MWGKTIKLAVGLGLSALTAVHSSAALAADEFPSKPIRMYVGFSAGSATDIVARVVADGLTKRLNQPVIVENKVGAGGSIAAENTVRADGDGYTLLTVSSAIAVNAAVYKNAAEVVDKLEPVALIGYLPTVLMASSKLPVNSAKEFLEYAKQRPEQVNYGSSGVGGSTHMAMESFARITGTKLTHIPYKGNGQASAALLGNQIDAMMETVLLAVPAVSGQRAKGLAISGAQRSPLMPDVPTFAEAGIPEYDRSLFFGVMAPEGVPPQLVERLNHEINAVLQDPAVQERLIKTGGLTLANHSATQFGETLSTELKIWREAAEGAGITPQ